VQTEEGQIQTASGEVQAKQNEMQSEQNRMQTAPDMLQNSRTGVDRQEIDMDHIAGEIVQYQTQQSRRI
jgi:hypothetical protein